MKFARYLDTIKCKSDVKNVVRQRVCMLIENRSMNGLEMEIRNE